MKTPEMEGGGEGSEESGEEEDLWVEENSKAIKKLSKQLVTYREPLRKSWRIYHNRRVGSER